MYVILQLPFFATTSIYGTVFLFEYTLEVVVRMISYRCISTTRVLPTLQTYFTLVWPWRTFDRRQMAEKKGGKRIRGQYVQIPRLVAKLLHINQAECICVCYKVYNYSRYRYQLLLLLLLLLRVPPTPSDLTPQWERIAYTRARARTRTRTHTNAHTVAWGKGPWEIDTLSIPYSNTNDGRCSVIVRTTRFIRSNVSTTDTRVEGCVVGE